MADLGQAGDRLQQDVFAIIKSTPHGVTDVVADTDPLTFQRGELPPQMDKAAFGLKEGQWTQLSRRPERIRFHSAC